VFELELELELEEKIATFSPAKLAAEHLICWPIGLD